MKVAIRADASLQIGTGHVMRCLTLAEVLRQQGDEVEFICRAHKGNLLERIQQQRFKVHELCPTVEGQANGNRKKETLYGEVWLGSTQEQDAEHCIAILEAMKPEWLIVDHYAIDQTWQILLKGSYKKLMVIDDLADRKHQCNILLDQTYGRKQEDYTALVPKDCQMLLGSQYALLRPEFAQWREYSLKRRANPELKKLLITMGGVDPDNVTGDVLDILKNCTLPKELEIIVVMGVNAPYLDFVQEQVKMMPYKTQVKVNVSNMADIMANADLAIGASGATTWERCCLGLPSIQIVIAENQKYASIQLSKSKAVRVIESVKELSSVLQILNLDLMTQRAVQLCDCLGGLKVAESLK
jgi:UDP-2,4-diacetamido-2,4,6-trideoxy-beta-L-altropyranose hydrolase